MRIGTRLALWLVAALLPLMVAFATVDERRTRARHLEELRREGRAVARTLQVSLEDSFADRDLEEAEALVESISRYERILGVRIFGADGHLIYESGSLSDVPFQFGDALERVLSTRTTVETDRRVGDEPAITFLLPLRSAGGDLHGAIQVLQLVSYIDEDARASRAAIATLTGVVVLAMTGIAFVTGRWVVGRRCDALVRRFREVGGGDFASRVETTPRDELGHLAEEFNAMCDRLEGVQERLREEQGLHRQTEVALQHAERLAGLGRLAAGLAHEIGTPLGVVRGRTERLLRQCAPDDPDRKNHEAILGQIDRMSRTVRGMLDFARKREPRPSRVELTGVLDGLATFLEHRLRGADVRLVTEIDDALPPLAVDADQIEDVLLNLLMNAVDAMPSGGTLQVRARPLADRPGRAEVEVEDTGTGIAPEHLARVFDPFFTTKDIGAGTGLGLSIVHGIVTRHGGEVRIESDPGRGTTVVLTLPCEEVPA